MSFCRMGEKEYEFAELIWDNEPIPSGHLVRLAEDKLDWKKSTSYTILKKLSDYGYFKNDNSLVSSLWSRRDYMKAMALSFLEDNFDGSIADFIEIILSASKLNGDEKGELVSIILRGDEK